MKGDGGTLGCEDPQTSGHQSRVKMNLRSQMETIFHKDRVNVYVKIRHLLVLERRKKSCSTSSSAQYHWEALERRGKNSQKNIKHETTYYGINPTSEIEL